MTAREVKAALYGRHFASSEQMPGPWTCIEEWRNIDLVAFSAWSSSSGGSYRRVGYEVKVSRSDLRGELLNPGKRAENVAWCNEFYLAVPKGLLTADELAFKEPDWQPEDFVRAPCTAALGAFEFGRYDRDALGPCHKGKREGPLVGPLLEHVRWRPHVTYECSECNGKGYLEKSLVERTAPTLWLPRDVGLIVVDGRGTKMVKKSPLRKEVAQLSAGELGALVRFVSMRPDPRHVKRPAAVSARIAA